MTNRQSQPLSVEITTDPVPPKISIRLKNWLNSHLIETINVSFIFSIGLFGVSAFFVWNVYRDFREEIRTQFQIQELSDRVVYLDEVLTMSARMGASTGNTLWEERYRNYEPLLDKTIKELTKLTPKSYHENTSQTDAANMALVEMEFKAFNLVRQGKSEEALKLLLSQNYELQKEIYSDGIENTLSKIQVSKDKQIQAYSQLLFWSLIFTAITLLILILTWRLIVKRVKIYIQERDQTQKSLLVSQEELQELNQKMELRSQEISLQEQKTQQENEILQEDISHILRIVSAVEEGDLTVKAEVNDRLTGLIADILNRLLEELARIISTVLETAAEVTSDAAELEKLAIITTSQAQKQAQSVAESKSLINNMAALSEDNLKETLLTYELVKQAQSAIAQGQREMILISGGIDALQEGNEQILKRLETLKDFVELATRFSSDQKRVAALTKVLAFNASMVAKRASTQQNPEQFITIAKEFETIAQQVSDLARETNEGLIIMQQRTQQIETVVSGLNQDAQDINQLVYNFTFGIGQSRQVFDNIQNVSTQVAVGAEKVTKSSQEMTLAIQTILKSIEDIATLASQTENQSQLTRQQSLVIRELAARLLTMVNFFRVAA